MDDNKERNDHGEKTSSKEDATLSLHRAILAAQSMADAGNSDDSKGAEEARKSPEHTSETGQDQDKA